MPETLTAGEVKMLRDVIASRQAGVGAWWPKWGPTVVTVIGLLISVITFGASVDKRMALQEQSQARMQADIQKLTATVEVLVVGQARQASPR